MTSCTSFYPRAALPAVVQHAFQHRSLAAAAGQPAPSVTLSTNLTNNLLPGLRVHSCTIADARVLDGAFCRRWPPLSAPEIAPDVLQNWQTYDRPLLSPSESAKSVHMRFVHSYCNIGLCLGGYVLDCRCDFRGIIELGEPSLYCQSPHSSILSYRTGKEYYFPDV